MNAEQDQTWLVALCLFLLALTLLLLADAGQAAEPALALTAEDARADGAGGPFDRAPLEVHDVDEDASKEILATDDERLYIFEPSGEAAFEAETTLPEAHATAGVNGPEAAVVDSEGTVGVFVTNAAAVVSSFRLSPDGEGTNHSLELAWERRLNTCTGEPSMSAKPVLADIDQDGEHEVILATEETGLYALNLDGSTAWSRCVEGGPAPPAVADLDRDGWPEVVHVTKTGRVAAFDGRDGDWRWVRDLAQRHAAGSASIPAQPGVGDLDGDGTPELVVGLHDEGEGSGAQARLVVLDGQGRTFWSYHDPEGTPQPGAVPAIADVDRNRRNEVFWATTSGPMGEEEASGRAHVYRLNHEGTLLWKRALDVAWRSEHVPLGDVDTDEDQEVLVRSGARGDRVAIAALDAHNGGTEDRVVFPEREPQKAPVVADLWANGTSQWIVPAAAAAPLPPALLVHNTQASFEAASPALPENERATEAETAGYPATFRITSPGEWWQEVYVDPDDDRQIARVEVRVDEGRWRTMDETTWGAWTSSFHTPEGTSVQFRSTDAAGARTLSPTFAWLDGNLTKRSVDAGQAPIGAEFRIGDHANDWWIEVYVNARVPLEAVQVRVEGGPWRSLERTAWGSWATSTHVPAGSSVQFRVTSPAGAQARSPTYAWLEDDFNASFDPTIDVADRWIEVDVEAPRELRAVDMRVDRGDWQPLQETYRGTWATHERLPSGVEVEFRATATTGERATSSPLFWP